VPAAEMYTDIFRQSETDEQTVTVSKYKFIRLQLLLVKVD